MKMKEQNVENLILETFLRGAKWILLLDQKHSTNLIQIERQYKKDQG